MKTMNGWLVLVCVGALATFSCYAQDTTRPKDVPPERAAAARAALMSWLECIECNDGELDAVARYAPEIEGALINTLRSGASPATRARIEAKLRQQFRANKWPASEERQYVETYVAAADTEYRVRAVKALARIATPGARKALEEAAEERKLPEDVRREAQEAFRALPPR